MNAVHYRWWVTVSTLDRGRPIRIPIIADPRLEENLAVNNETLANHLQATHTPEEGWTFHVIARRNNGRLQKISTGKTATSKP